MHNYIGRIKKCVPDAIFDSWGHYQWVGRSDGKPEWASISHGQRTGYLESAVIGLVIELREYLDGNPTKQQIDAWFDARSNVNAVAVSQLQAIEDFVELRRVERQHQTAEAKKDRKKFYVEKAKSLDPPIEYSILEECQSFRRAIAITRPPISLERSWNTLLPKVLEDAKPIQTLIAKQKENDDLRDYRSQLLSCCHSNFVRRITNDSPEQRFVLALADTVIDEMRCSETSTADVDLIPLILQGVYNAYQSSDPKPISPINEKPYRLIMDDAKMVYSAKISPLLGRLEPTRRSIAKQLTCVYCHDISSGPMTNSAFLFEGLFHHICQHGKVPWSHKNELVMPLVSHECGPTHWLTIEWPKRLPIRPAYHSLAYLQGHEKTAGIWNPEETLEYERVEVGFWERNNDCKGYMTLHGLNLGLP